MATEFTAEGFWERLSQAVNSATQQVFDNRFSIIITTAGLALLIVWMLRDPDAVMLRSGPVRRNSMAAFVPLILIGIWLAATTLVMVLLRWLIGQRAELQAMFYPANALLQAALAAGMLLTARALFARRLKGFGLDLRTLGKDALWALVYLVAAYPLILIGLWAVLAGGRFVRGPGFSMETHESLDFLAGADSTAVQTVVVVFAVVIVPFFEEVLFRGFLQTALRNLSRSGWLAIIVTSALFAVLHPAQHVLGLFFLSCAMGYAYERSGSLWRPILMHVFFNGLSVAAVLMQALLEG